MCVAPPHNDKIDTKILVVFLDSNTPLPFQTSCIYVFLLLFFSVLAIVQTDWFSLTSVTKNCSLNATEFSSAELGWYATAMCFPKLPQSYFSAIDKIGIIVKSTTYWGVHETVSAYVERLFVDVILLRNKDLRLSTNLAYVNAKFYITMVHLMHNVSNTGITREQRRKLESKQIEAANILIPSTKVLLCFTGNGS